MFLSQELPAQERTANVAPSGTVWLDCDELSESSGLARSRREPSVLWTHNDSGDSPRLFAFSMQGKWLETVEVKKAKSIDWEDMCSFVQDDVSYLAIADVGDNAFMRSYVSIYGLREPAVDANAQDDDKKKKDKDKKGKKPEKSSSKVDFEVRVTYPVGPINCEAIAYDPWRRQFILATKEQLQSRIYAVAFDPKLEDQQVVAQLITTVAVPLVTGASISDDGQLLALATYGPTCLLRRPTKTDWARAEPDVRRTAGWQSASGFDLELIEAPARRQGEAVCFAADNQTLLISPTPLTVKPTAGTAC